MLIQEALLAFIEKNVPSAGIGYPVLIPVDKPLPAWAYQVLDDEEILSHKGKTGFVKAYLQITVNAAVEVGKSQYQSAMTIANAIRTALDGYQGLMGTVPVYYCHVKPISDEWAAQREIPVARLRIRINYRR